MVTLAEVEKQLKAIGANTRFRFWGRSEIIELQHVLIPNERIQACLNGRYEGGFAVLCATDQRLLLIDKKIFHLSVEDVRYDMIAEVDYSSQLASAAVKIRTPTKDLSFVAFRPSLLRPLVNYTQQRVLEIRQQYAYQQQPQQPSRAVAQSWSPQNFPLPPQTQQPLQPWSSPAPVEQPEPEPQMQQAIEVAQNIDTTPLPVPHYKNPYMNPPLMMRKRIGRFGTIAAADTFRR